MAIVITSVPPYQVLNEALDATSYLSMFVTGLDNNSGVPVTATLDGTAFEDFEPPEVISVTPSGNAGYQVILELTGAIELDEKNVRVIPRQRKPDRMFDPELTVTICQGLNNCSSPPTPVNAIFIYLDQD